MSSVVFSQVMYAREWRASQAAHEAPGRAAGHVPLPVALSGPRAGSA